MSPKHKNIQTFTHHPRKANKNRSLAVDWQYIRNNSFLQGSEEVEILCIMKVWMQIQDIK